MRSLRPDVVLASLVLALAAWVITAVVVLASLAPLSGLVPHAPAAAPATVAGLALTAEGR